MTVLEQRFMERVPNLLGDIAESLETIAKAKQPKQTVWVVTFLNDCEWGLNLSVNVFGTEEEARKCLEEEWQTLTASEEYDEVVSNKNDDDFLFEDHCANRTYGEIKEKEVVLSA